MLDFINGLIDGSGFFDGLFGSAAEIGGEAFAAGMERAAGGLFGAEGLVGRLFGAVDFAADLYIDSLFLRDVTGQSGALPHNGFQSFFKKPKAQILDPVRPVIKAHAFIRQQLSRAVEQNTDLAPLAEEYKSRGFHLPDADLVDRAYKALAKLSHPDKIGQEAGDALFKELGESKEQLTKGESLPAYRAMVARAATDETLSQQLHSVYVGMDRYDWGKGFEAAASKARLRLTGPEGSAAAREGSASEWIARALDQPSALRQGALVFGVLTGVGLGAYGIFRLIDHKQPTTIANEPPPSHVATLNQTSSSATAHSR